MYVSFSIKKLFTLFSNKLSKIGSLHIQDLINIKVFLFVITPFRDENLGKDKYIYTHQEMLYMVVILNNFEKYKCTFAG